MSFLAKFSRFWGKQPSNNRLILSLRPSSLAVFYLENGQISAQNAIEMPLVSSSYSLTIEQLCKQHDFQGQVTLVLNASQYHTTQVDKPDVATEELHNALIWQVKDIVPLAAEDIFLDYYQSPALSSGTEKLNVVCASKVELQTLVSVINTDVLKVAEITIPEFCFTQLLPKTDTPILLLGQQANEELFILIVQNGQLYFHRHLRGFANLGDKTIEQLSFGALDSLSLEIQKSVDYFERQLKQPAVSEIKTLIPVEHEPVIIEKLGQNTHLPISALELADSWQNYRHLSAAVGASFKYYEPTQGEEVADE